MKGKNAKWETLKRPVFKIALAINHRSSSPNVKIICNVFTWVNVCFTVLLLFKWTPINCLSHACWREITEAKLIDKKPKEQVCTEREEFYNGEQPYLRHQRRGDMHCPYKTESTLDKWYRSVWSDAFLLTIPHLPSASVLNRAMCCDEQRLCTDWDWELAGMLHTQGHNLMKSTYSAIF